MLSSNIRHYHSLLFYVAWVSIGFGVVMTVIDVWADMPVAWTLTEGPLITFMGVAMVYLLSRIVPTEASDSN